VDRKSKPLVTVGVPVFNGERFLAKALGSVEGQNFADFEVVVLDNASTDRTGEIVEQFAKRDHRFKYFRNETNIGLFPNFNRCLGLASGKYFMWLAHDDYLHPDYLKRAVAALEEKPEAVLFHTRITVVDDEERAVGSTSSAPGLDNENISKRFDALVCEPTFALEIFGLIRREQLLKATPMESFLGSDRVVTCRLSLNGPFLSCDDALFFNRDHPNRSCRQDRRILQKEGEPSWGLRLLSPRSLVYCGFVRALYDADLPTSTKWSCAKSLVRWWFVHRNGINLLIDNFSYRLPAVVAVVRRTTGLKLNIYPR
jgi:glycosyltransferase involved in cell wall biosynthesis